MALNSLFPNLTFEESLFKVFDLATCFTVVPVFFNLLSMSLTLLVVLPTADLVGGMKDFLEFG